MIEPRVLVFIINFKQLNKTLACLKSFTACNYSNKKIFILDNGSTGNSYQSLKSGVNTFPSLEILTFQSLNNLGFAGGTNFIISQTRNEKYDYIFLINNDALVMPNTLQELVLLAQATSSNLLGSSVKNGDGQLLFHSRKWPYFLFGFKVPYPHKAIGAWSSDYIEGSSLMITKKLTEARWQENGYFFDPQYFLYLEDVELSLWAKKRGENLLVSSKTHIIHEVSSSSGGAGNPLVYYYITRNRFFAGRKYLSTFNLILFYLWLLMSRPLILLKHYFKGNSKTVKAIRSGIADGINRKYGIKEDL